MKDPKVTVLMSVYNGEKYLREAIDSILNQTFTDFEFLIVNDGSMDGTGEILESYKDPRIKVINNEENIGLTKSLNKGLKMARGEYIARMDADDVSYPNRLKEEFSVIVKDDTIGMVTSWFDIINQRNPRDVFYQIVRNTNSPEEIFYTAMFLTCIAHPTVMFNKKLVLSLGGYDEKYRLSQDKDLWIKLSKVSKIVKIKKSLFALRIHKEKIGYTDSKQQGDYSKEIFLREMYNLISKDTDPKLLSNIRYDNIELWDIMKAMSLLNKINHQIENVAYSGLDMRKIKKCESGKKWKLLRNVPRATIKNIIKSLFYLFKRLINFVKDKFL